MGSGVNIVESTAFGMTETVEGRSDARSTVFSLLKIWKKKIIEQILKKRSTEAKPLN